jgi:N-acetylmuramoyl-L-alanine amidase
MLKIHSFLRRVKEPIGRIIPTNVSKYKLSIAIIAYMLITILFLLSPDYIYGTGSSKIETLAKAETTTDVSGINKDMVEGTANEAIVRNQNNSGIQFILCNLTTDNRPDGLFYLLDGLTEGKTNNYTVNNPNTKNSEEKINLIDKKADSNQAGAVASQVESSSTKEKKEQETVKAEDVKETADKKATKSTKITLAKNDAEKKTNLKATSSEKTASKETKKSDDKKIKYIIKVNDDDITILQRIVEAEATGEDIKGKILVANVIINRVKGDEFPKSIEGVVFQRKGSTYQFSPIKDKRYWSVTVTKKTKEAVERALTGEDYSEGALYFSARSRADKSSMSWFDNNLQYLFRYGGHEFFR